VELKLAQTRETEVTARAEEAEKGVSRLTEYLTTYKTECRKAIDELKSNLCGKECVSAKRNVRKLRAMYEVVARKTGLIRTLADKELNEIMDTLVAQ